MINVLFGESESGSLKCARSSGLTDEVICLAVMADIGEISKPMFGKYRAGLICRMYYGDQWGPDEEMIRDVKHECAVYSRQAKRLEHLLKAGESVRVWVSDCPYSRCGMLWLSGLFAKYKTEVYAVEMSRFNKMTAAESKGVLTVRSGWGECEPEDFVKALPLAERIPQIKLTANYMRWRRLKEENAPLRAVISGEVVSVPEDFYDFLIWRYLENKPVKEAFLIGTILGKNRLGVGDWWYAHRIERFIREKRIKIIEDNERKYARVISRAKRL